MESSKNEIKRIIPSITLNNSQTKDKIFETLFRLYPYIIRPSLSPLTTGELNLLTSAALLPVKLISTPFALTPKKLYQQWLELTSSNLNSLVNSLEIKGYLVLDEYGERDFNPTLKNIIKMINVCPEFEIRMKYEVDKKEPKNNTDVS